METPQLIMSLVSVLGNVVGIIALALYVREKMKVEPTIQRTIVHIADEPDRYMIKAELSNEGERKAKNCTAIIQMDGNTIQHLVFTRVDSPIGRIGFDWPVEQQFTMYPQRPITVRGYLNAKAATRISLVLRMNGKECDQIAFTLPERLGQ